MNPPEWDLEQAFRGDYAESLELPRKVMAFFFFSFLGMAIAANLIPPPRATTEKQAGGSVPAEIKNFRCPPFVAGRN